MCRFGEQLIVECSWILEFDYRIDTMDSGKFIVDSWFVGLLKGGLWNS